MFLYLTERVCAICQVLQYRHILTEMVVRVAQINLMTNHSDIQLIVKPAERKYRKVIKMNLTFSLFICFNLASLPVLLVIGKFYRTFLHTFLLP